MVLTALVLPRLEAGPALGAVAPVAGYLLPVAAASLAMSCAPHTSALVLARVGFLVIVGVALAGTARARGGARLLALTGSSIGVLAAIIAIWQGCRGFASQAKGADLLPGPIRELILARLGSGRVFGPFLLPASLGGALAITAPLTVALAWQAAGRRRLAWSAGVLVQVVALVWSISLGAWIALAAAVTAVLVAPLAKSPRGRRTMVAGLVGAGLFVAAGVFARSRLLPAPGPEDRPMAYRSGNWNVAVAMIRDHPFFGTGPGTFGEMFPAYRRDGMNESRYAHCTYLQLVAELGVGVLPLLALVPLGAVALVRRARAGGAIGVAASVGGLSFLLHNFVDFTFYQPGVGALFVLATAIASGSGADAKIPAQKTAGVAGPGPGKDAAGRSSAPAWSAGYVVVLASSIVIGTILFFSGISDLARERAILAHERGAEVEAQLLTRAIHLDPFDPEPRGDLAGILAARGRRGAAEEDLVRGLGQAQAAAALDPRTAFRRNDIARIELMRGHPATAWVELTRAAALYPLKADYRRDLADLEKKLFTTRSAPAGAAGPAKSPVTTEVPGPGGGAAPP